MLSMSCGLSQREVLSQRHELRQSLEIIQARCLSLRLELIHALRGIRYTPSAQCLKCNRILTPVEIIRGFNQDPNDFTTACSGCGHRFNPKLRHDSTLGTIDMPFYCGMQTLNQLRGLEGKSPDELDVSAPAVYHSAIVHYGTLRRAFAEIGVKYGFDEITDWEKKIRPFLGRLPDTVIAQAAGVSAKAVSKQRKLHNGRYPKIQTPFLRV